MSSLKADFDELRERIRHGRELGHALAVFYVHQDGGVRALFMVDPDDLRLLAAMCNRMADELDGLCEDTSPKQNCR